MPEGRQQPKADECTCLAVRQAARHITQLYDQHLAASGLRTTQFSILSKLKRLGAMTINELAASLVTDRTTLSRNIGPLERDGLIVVVPGRTDRRRRELQLTDEGEQRFLIGCEGWAAAQKQFEAAFGTDRAAGLRSLLHEAAAVELA